MFDFMCVTKALADENRVRILMALHQAELCVCQLTALLDLAPSTTSKHLSVLRQARLINSTKHGKWVYYALPQQEDAAPGIWATLRWLEETLSDHPAVLADVKKVQTILADGAGTCHGDEYHSSAIHLLESAEAPEA